MPPPSMRPPMWNNQPQIPGTDLPPVPSGANPPPPFVPPPPPGTSVRISIYIDIILCLGYSFIETY